MDSRRQPLRHRPGNNRVLKLAAGSSTQTVLPFTGLNEPEGVAVDAAGNLYVADVTRIGWWNWRRGRPPRACCRSPASGPPGVAVDTAGNLYVTDFEQQSGAEAGGRLEHPGGLPFTGLNGPTVWRWMPPATSTSPTISTIGW